MTCQPEARARLSAAFAARFAPPAPVEADHPVVPALAAVDDARPVGDRVDEEEEVVARPVPCGRAASSCVMRAARGTPCARMTTGLQSCSASSERPPGSRRWSPRRCTSGLAGVRSVPANPSAVASRSEVGTVLAAVDLLAVFGLPDALEQLVDRQVECGVLVGARGFGAHDRTGADQGQFDAIVPAGAARLVVADTLISRARAFRRGARPFGLLDGVLSKRSGSPLRDR